MESRRSCFTRLRHRRVKTCFFTAMSKRAREHSEPCSSKILIKEIFIKEENELDEECDDSYIEDYDDDIEPDLNKVSKLDPDECVEQDPLDDEAEDPLSLSNTLINMDDSSEDEDIMWKPACDDKLRTWLDIRPAIVPFPYNEKTGLKNIQESTNPIDWFLHIFDDEWIQYIVQQTNRNAQEQYSQQHRRKARIKSWKPVTVDEFKIFLALIFMMGFVQLPNIECYWKKDNVFDTPNFRKYMGRDRFQLILRMLHFAKPSIVKKPDHSLSHIRPVMDLFNDRMHSIYVPHKNLCIIESPVLMISRFSGPKRNRSGINLYMLADANGVVLKYYGIRVKDYNAKVVIKLLEGYENKGHSVFSENCFTIELAEYLLLAHKTNLTGAIDPNMNFGPPAFNTHVKGGGVICSFTTSGIALIKYKDRNITTLLSSEFGPVMKKISPNVSKPEAIIQYEKNKKGSEFISQILSFFPMDKKVLRWYIKLGVHILDLALYNSYVLFNLYCQNTKIKTSLQYRTEVVKALLNCTPDVSRSPTTFKNLHIPSKTSKKQRCDICTRSDKQKMVQTYCADCEEKPFLCIPNCFKQYHCYE